MCLSSWLERIPGDLGQRPLVYTLRNIIYIFIYLFPRGVPKTYVVKYCGSRALDFDLHHY